MATYSYYVNLDINTNPGYLNTTSSPLGWDDFKSITLAPAANTNNLYFKGSRNDGTSSLLIKGYTSIRLWPGEVQPWRLNIQKIDLSGDANSTISIYNGIVQTTELKVYVNYTTTGANFALIDSYMKCLGPALFNTWRTTQTYSNSVFICESFLTNSGIKALFINNSIIDVNTTATRTGVNILNTSVFNNSVFTNSFFDDIPAYQTGEPIIATNCDFHWVPPVWPDWNDVDLLTPDWDVFELFVNPKEIFSRLFFTQRTNRHIVKSLIIPQDGDAYYSSHFGTYGISGNSTSSLNSPWNIAFHSSGYFYICDHNNERIVKLSKNLNFLGEYSTSLTIGKPCAILVESDSIFAVGINYHIIENDVLYMYINIEKLDENLSSIKFTRDTLGINYRLEQRKGEISYKPISIVRGYNPNEFLISGVRKKIYSVNELDNGFSNLTDQTFYNERPTRFLGMIHHTNDFLYLNTGTKIIKFNSSFVNVGSSDYIGKSIYGLKESINGNLLTYKIDNQSLLEYDANLNFVKEIVKDIDDTLENDLYDIIDFVDASF